MNLLKDPTRKLYFQFLIPAISSAIAVAIYCFVDTIAIGQGVGPNGAAACAVFLPIFSTAQFIALLCGIGGSVLMTQARGSGNREKGDAYYTTALILVSMITLVLWIPGMIFQDPFYRLCGADDVLLPYAKEYGKWILRFLPTFTLVSFFGCFIRSDGGPKYVMTATLIGGSVNIIGDWLFVFPLNMGMTGAALATVLGSTVQMLLLLGYVLLKKTTLHLAKPYDWMRACRKMLSVGFGAGFSQIALIVLTFIMNNQIMRYSGPAALAVYGMISTISALFMCIFSGIGEAAQPIVSANFGAGQHSRCRKVERLGMKTAIVFGLVTTGICELFPSQITSIFIKVTPEVAEIAPYILRVYALSFFPLAISTFFTLYLQSIMRVRMASVISLLRGIVLTGILLYVLPLFMEGKGIWWAVTIAESAAALVAVAYMVQLSNSRRKNNTV